MEMPKVKAKVSARRGCEWLGHGISDEGRRAPQAIGHATAFEPSNNRPLYWSVLQRVPVECNGPVIKQSGSIVAGCV